MKKIKPEQIILILIIIAGAFLRFYKLDWGQGLFAHPDEYHIVISVNQLNFPNQMNPHFFSYGTTIIYPIYFTQEIFRIPNTFLIGRFYSALFSALTIWLVFKIALLLLPQRFALISAALVAFTPGLIQQAHFATPESILIFFLIASLLNLLYFTKQEKFPHLIFASIFLGLALATKVSTAMFTLTFATTIILLSRLSFTKLLKIIVPSLLIILITFAITNPYTLLDFSSFKSNLDYESTLATGTIPVFYTRQFIETTPFLFQLEKILPFALGPALLISGFLGLILLILFGFRQKQTNIAWLIVLTAFFSLFIPNNLLFAKWTRFISPAFPFFALFTTFLLFKTSQRFSRSIFYFLSSIFLLIPTFLWATAFFSIYLRPDVRLTADRWLTQNIAPRSSFLTESGNTVEVPLTGSFTKIPFDFYNLDTNPLSRQQLITGLEAADYFIIQSRRVFFNHQRLPQVFPFAANFYHQLFAGELGFVQIKKFHSYPSLSLGTMKLEFPDEGAEETWTVFDHPVIRVFQKNQQLTAGEYDKMLK